MLRFEIVHTNPGHLPMQPWHARIRAGNSKKWWVTEQYARRASAEKAAVNLIVELTQPDSWELADGGLVIRTGGANRLIEIVDRDERQAATT